MMKIPEGSIFCHELDWVSEVETLPEIKASSEVAQGSKSQFVTCKHIVILLFNSSIVSRITFLDTQSQ